MRLLVGAPVRDRAWIVERWMDHLEETVVQAKRKLTLDSVSLMFVADHRNDAETIAAIDRGCLKHGFSRGVSHVDGPKEPYRRDWSNASRFQEMADLRNRLLSYVRVAEPDLFWSLDTDILVHPQTLVSALEAMAEHDFHAVGTKLHMVPEVTDRRRPSYGMLTGSGFKREDSDQVLKVDVIMASKIMSPAAYKVDYGFDRLGEDIGWSKNARRAGLKLGWDGRVCSRHVMSREALDQDDPRC